MDWRESKMERGTGCLGNTSQVYGVAHGDAPSGVPPVATKPVGLERANEWAVNQTIPDVFGQSDSETGDNLLPEWFPFLTRTDEKATNNNSSSNRILKILYLMKKMLREFKHLMEK